MPVGGLAAAAEVSALVAGRLAGIDHVAAIVLGGSRARGDADERSDVDIGLYYDPQQPPPLAGLQAAARELDDRHLPEPLTDFGGWGPWINGGGWLVIRGVRVDWVYRDLAKIAQAVADAEAGRYSSHYQPGHPHAFHTHMYVAEVHHGRPLVERDGRFAALQARTAPYPAALRAEIMRRNVWEAGFALDNAAKAAERGDAAYVTGCLFRSAACLVQALFALNERYFMNEKGSVAIAGALPRAPAGFAGAVTSLLAAPGQGAAALEASLARMRALVSAAAALAAAGRP